MGNMAFGNFSIGTISPDDDAYSGYPQPDKDASIKYRGFEIDRARPFFLYRIVPREGFQLWRTLDGNYTTAEIAKKQIDVWYSECDWAVSADDAFIKQNDKPKRGRPTKKEQAARAIEEAFSDEAN
jgi:hypothetical protein